MLLRAGPILSHLLFLRFENLKVNITIKLMTKYVFIVITASDIK